MRRLLIGTALLIFATPCLAGVNRWTPVGPPGGSVAQLLPDPSTPDVVWALVNGRPFRSSDGGATWSERSTGLPYPMTIRTDELALDPARPATLLAAVFAAEVYRTVDAGLTWSRVIDSSVLGSRVFLHVDPAVPGTFYAVPASASLRILRSTDHGATWAAVGTAAGHGLNDYVESFAVDPASAGRWYAVLFNTGTNRLLVSTDAGATWPQRGGGLPKQFRDLVVAPTSPPTLFVYSTGSGLYRSTDGGTTFAQSGLGRIDVRIIAVDPGDPRTIYGLRDVSRPTQVFRSTDSGATWDAIDLQVARLPTAWIGSLAVDPGDATHLWIGTPDDGVLQSADLGASWTSTSTGLPRDRSVCTLAVAPGGTTLHAVTDGALWTSRDAGASWSPNAPALPVGWPAGAVSGVAIDPTDADVVYVASPSGVFKSIDGGVGWNPAGSGLPASGARMVAVDPLTPRTVYATTPDGVYRSVDGGASWTLRGPGSFSSLVVDPTLPSTIYFDGGLAVSRDGGATSAPPSLYSPFVAQPGVVQLLATIAPAPSAPGKVYAGLDATVFFPDRSFRSFASLNVSADRLATYDLLSATIAPSALAVDPTDDQALYVGRYDGARRSRDGGVTLEPFDAGLRGTPCTLVAGAPGEPLYAGTMPSDGTRLSFGVYAIEEPACSADADCDDATDCTTDRCRDGRCAHDAVANGSACSTPEDPCAEAGSCFDGTCRAFRYCNDGDSCTTDRCDLPGVCRHEAIAGCCTDAADCDDGDACTTDTCTASRCVSTVDPSSCDDRRVASASIRIVARPDGSKVTFETADTTVVVPAAGGADDPSLVGATVELFPAGSPAVTWTLPAGVGRPGWKAGTASGLAFLYANPAAPSGPAPVRRLALRARPQLRLTALPTADPLAGGTPDRLGIRITVGTQRLCALFTGGAIRKRGPGLLVARGAMLPAGACDAASLGGAAP